MPTCSGCRRELPKASFTNSQLDKNHGKPKYCKNCNGATARDFETGSRSSKQKAALGGRDPQELVQQLRSGALPAVTQLLWSGRVRLDPSAALKLLLSVPQRPGLPASAGADLVEGIAAAGTWAPLGQAYFAHLARHAVVEFLAEAEEAFEQIWNRDAAWLAQRGATLRGAWLRPGRKSGEVVAEWEVVPGAEGRGIQSGDFVAVGPEDFTWPPVECEVAAQRPLVLKPLADAEAQRLLSARCRLRVDKLGNRQQYARVVRAVHLLCAPPREPTASQMKKASSGSRGLPPEARPSEAVLRLLLPLQQALAPPASPPGVADAEGLTTAQHDALCAALTAPVTLIQGPPGTGKTTVAVRVLCAWARQRPGGILAASDSNLAVDHLLEGLTRAGVRALRLGRPETARPELLAHCADEQACQVLGVRSLGELTPEGREQLHGVLGRLVQQAEVVCCTAVGAGSGKLSRHLFSRVLLDEASQATEACTLVPLCRGARQVVLCGDQCQLPPTVSSEAAREAGAELSLFERLAHAGLKPHLLDCQYRMHPAISAFPRETFYDGRLADGVTAEDRPAPEGYPWPDPARPVCLEVHAGAERKDGDSYYNELEAEGAAAAVLGLLQAGLDRAELGVVSPYGSQVRLLRRVLQRHGVATLREQGGVEVASVDSYQGREKDVIVFSAVRSGGGLGFVADWRRMNVAFTRARRGLVVLGDPVTLAREPACWGPWVRWVQKEGLHRGELPPVPDAPAPPVGLRAERMRAAGELASAPTLGSGVGRGARGAVFCAPNAAGPQRDRSRSPWRGPGLERSEVHTAQDGWGGGWENGGVFLRGVGAGGWNAAWPQAA